MHLPLRISAYLCLSAALHGSLLLLEAGTPYATTARPENRKHSIAATLAGQRLALIAKHERLAESSLRTKSSTRKETPESTSRFPLPTLPIDNEEPAYWAPDEVEERAVAKELPDDTPMPEPGADSGRLLIKLFIGREGNVEKVEILESSLPESYSQDLADFLTKQSFMPARKQGAGVASWKLMELVLEPGPPASPEERTVATGNRSLGRGSN